MENFSDVGKYLRIPCHMITLPEGHEKSDPAAISGIADMLKAKGSNFSPIMVEKVDDEEFEVIWNGHLLEAAQQANLSFVWCIVGDAESRQQIEAEMAPITNVEDVNNNHLNNEVATDDTDDDKSPDNEVAIDDDDTDNNKLPDNEVATNDNKLPDNEVATNDNKLPDNEVATDDPDNNKLPDNEVADNDPPDEEWAIVEIVTTYRMAKVKRAACPIHKHVIEWT